MPSGNLEFISGPIVKRNGEAWVGQLGLGMDTEEAKTATRAVAIDLPGTLPAAVGDLERVRCIVKGLSPANRSAACTDQHLVTNGASELLVAVFGADIGSYARRALDLAQLPMGACVKTELIAEVARKRRRARRAPSRAPSSSAWLWWPQRWYCSCVSTSSLAHGAGCSGRSSSPLHWPHCRLAPFCHGPRH